MFSMVISLVVHQRSNNDFISVPKYAEKVDQRSRCCWPRLRPSNAFETFSVVNSWIGIEQGQGSKVAIVMLSCTLMEELGTSDYSSLVVSIEYFSRSLGT